MKRTAIKTVTNDELEFIPPKYKDMDRDAPDMYDRPLIFKVKRLKREQKYEMQEKTRLKYYKDPKEIDFDNIKPGDVEILGNGDATKYVWDNCVVRALNVIIDDNGKEMKHEVFENPKLLWNSIGLDDEIIQTVKFIIDQSSFSEAEAKN